MQKHSAPHFALAGLSVGATAILLVALAVTGRTPRLGAASCSELMVNGGFEQNELGWAAQPSPPLSAGASLIDAFYPRTGNLGAYLAGRNGATDRLSQQVALPAGADSLTLDLWWALNTQETGGAFDSLHVALYDASGTLLASLLTTDNTGAADWVWSNLRFDLTPYAGQTRSLRFTATNDNANPTAFFIDDVSLIACVAEPAATASPSPTPTPSGTPTSTATAPPPTPTHSPTPTGTTAPQLHRSYLPLAVPIWK